MNVLIADFWLVLNSVSAREAEIMLNLKEKGDRIYYLECDGMTTAGCGFSVFKKSSSCSLCRYKRNRDHRVCGISSYITEKLKFDRIVSGTTQLIPYREYKNIGQLMELEYKGIDIGRGIAALINTDFRDSDPELTSELQQVVNSFANELAAYIDFLEDVIEKYHIDAAYIFNGRIGYQRATLRMMQQKNIDAYVHEDAGAVGKYALFYNSYPHSVVLSHGEIDSIWDLNCNTALKEQKSKEWFAGRETGASILHERYHFVKDQISGDMPFIKSGKLNVAVFISSEDEFVTIQELDTWYRNQNEVLKQIADFNWGERVNFIVRVHPNLKDLDNAQTKGLKEISGQNITIIPAESSVSSYQLLKECDAALVFISTMGIEACYWKKPVIILGKPAYKDLLTTVKPGSFEALCEAIENFEKTDFHLEENYIAALKYAWYQMNYGIEFKYFKALDLFYYKYTGKRNAWFYYYEILEFFRRGYKKLRRRIAGDRRKT